MSILYGTAHIGDAVNATVIKLEDEPEGYAAFDSGVAQKFVLDPHGMVPQRAHLTSRERACSRPGRRGVGAPRRGGKRTSRPRSGRARDRRSGRTHGSSAARVSGVWMWHWAAPDDDPEPFQRNRLWCKASQLRSSLQRHVTLHLGAEP